MLLNTLKQVWASVKHPKPSEEVLTYDWSKFKKLISWDKELLVFHCHRFLVPTGVELKTKFPGQKYDEVKEAMHLWCEEYCQGTVMLGGHGRFMFMKDEQDAMAFKLYWE